MHYAAVGVWNGWTYEQVCRLCRLLNVTEFELARLCAIPWNQYERWRNANRFPPYVALQFKMLESWFLEQSGVPREPILPIHLLAVA
jgi:hypothetical protein